IRMASGSPSTATPGRAHGRARRPDPLPPLLGLLLIAVAAATWGTTGATLKLVARESPMSPLLVGFFRVAIAAACLWLMALRAAEPRGAPAPGDRWRLVVAGVAQAGYQVGYFYGVASTGVAVAALIAICSAPIIIIGL